jgi:ABC-type nitrate/sulfonate/bicarbonate transport system ATPase subunit
VVGPSAAGKTTLLNIIAGLDEDVSGDIRLGLRERPANGKEAARIAFVFQTPRLMPWLSVLDNVRLVLGDSDEDQERARQLLDAVGLTEFIDAFPSRLSGGMQRRVALARAFAVRPQLLLMDEPFVSLDSPTAWRLRQQLLALWDDLKPTILFVTHDLREALTLSDRVLFLSSRPGRVVLEKQIRLPRPRAPQDAAVLALEERLMKDHPQILSGLAERSAPSDVDDASTKPS